MMENLRITEATPSDISTVYAYLKEPGVYPNGSPKCCDLYSTFDGQYPLYKEREFIQALHEEKGHLYSHYHIGWSSCD